MCAYTYIYMCIHAPTDTNVRAQFYAGMKISDLYLQFAGQIRPKS